MLHRLLLKAGVGFQPIFLSDHQNILSLYHLPVKAPDLVLHFIVYLRKGSYPQRKHIGYIPKPQTISAFTTFAMKGQITCLPPPKQIQVTPFFKAPVQPEERNPLVTRVGYKNTICPSALLGHSMLLNTFTYIFCTKLFTFYNILPENISNTQLRMFLLGSDFWQIKISNTVSITPQDSRANKMKSQPKKNLKNKNKNDYTEVT